MIGIGVSDVPPSVTGVPLPRRPYVFPPQQRRPGAPPPRAPIAHALAPPVAYAVTFSSIGISIGVSSMPDVARPSAPAVSSPQHASPRSAVVRAHAKPAPPRTVSTGIIGSPGTSVGTPLPPGAEPSTPFGEYPHA